MIKTARLQIIILTVLLAATFFGCISDGTGVSSKDKIFLSREFWETATPESVQEKLDQGVSIHTENTDKNSPLTLAVTFCEDPAVTKLLLEAGADVHHKNTFNSTPLDVLLFNKTTLEKVKLLIDAGTDVNNVDTDGFTAIFTVCRHQKDPQILQELIDAGADLGHLLPKGWSVLHYAARYTDVPEFLGILIDAGAAVNLDTEDGLTPLMLATFNNTHHAELVKILLDAGADVNTLSDAHKSALMYAAEDNVLSTVIGQSEITSTGMGDDPETVRLLLEAGANVNIRSNSGWTALMVAAETNTKPEVISLLLEAGAQVHTETAAGVTALMIAADNNSKAEVTKLLIEAGADVHKGTNKGWNPVLMAALNNPNPEVMKALLEAGADVNSAHPDGWTPLILAVDKNFDNDVELVTLLLEAGADVNAASDNGLTPLLAASVFNRRVKTDPDGKEYTTIMHGNDREVVRLLLEAGADVNARFPGNGETPLLIAAAENTVDVVEVLLEYNPNLDTTDNDGKTALMNACFDLSRHTLSPGKIEALIDAGADTGIKAPAGVAFSIGGGKQMTFKEGVTAFELLEINTEFKNGYPEEYNQLLSALR